MEMGSSKITRSVMVDPTAALSVPKPLEAAEVAEETMVAEVAEPGEHRAVLAVTTLLLASHRALLIQSVPRRVAQ